MISYGEFCSNCERLEERVRRAAESCGRNFEDVKILPVTKTHPVAAAEYALRRGFAAVGENRVQEASEKIPLLEGRLAWELIGHLQSNKAAAAVRLFDRVESVDSERLLKKLDAAAAKDSKILRILLQINAGDDPAKFGASVDGAPALMEAALACPNLRVEGLMTIAPLDSDLDTASACFARLRGVRDDLEARFGAALPELSMGMSSDLERAVREGSTLIRVGTFLFGQRQ